jgi:methionyl aminopeptidase
MVLIKTSEQIKQMRKLGKINSAIMNKLIKFTTAGITSKDIEQKANMLMQAYKVKPAFLGYKGYPASLCVSVNEELIHGIPSEKKVLSGGDLISIDFGLTDGRFYSDMAKSFFLGRVSGITKDILKTGRQALDKAIRIIKPSVRLGDIGWEIENFVKSKGFYTVKRFVGHGIGESLHEEPEVPNFGNKNEGLELKEGMVIAIEPMITMDSSEVEVLDDGWTVVSSNRKLCVHFEHTVAVRRRGAEILTN